MFESILVVCTGNICRSPIGERFLLKMLPNKNIASAGTGALEGHDADEHAIKVASMNNISLSGHKGKQFTQDLARQYDLILAMEKNILSKLVKLRLKQGAKLCYSVTGSVKKIFRILIAKVRRHSYQSMP